MLHKILQRDAQLIEKMIASQLRPNNVIDEKVLDAYRRLPRALFIPEDISPSAAYCEIEIPLGEGISEHMLEPKLEARMLQELNLGPSDHLLIIGLGSGCVASLASHLCHHVTAVEINPKLYQRAKRLLSKYQLSNIDLLVGDLNCAKLNACPYDHMLITASTEQISPSWAKWLAKEANLLVVVGSAPVMCLYHYVRNAQGTGFLAPHTILDTYLQPLQDGLVSSSQRFAF